MGKDPATLSRLAISRPILRAGFTRSSLTTIGYSPASQIAAKLGSETVGLIGWIAEPITPPQPPATGNNHLVVEPTLNRKDRK
jgi:hypothetical protein